MELVVTSDFARRRFAEVVLPHLDDAYGLARWLTGSGTDAEDVVQEACLRALASLEAATIERPRAWLLTIVRNSAITWLAKNRSDLPVISLDDLRNELEIEATDDQGKVAKLAR